MNELNTIYKGGYRQTSNYLKLKHNANFADLVDAFVYIYNFNKGIPTKYGKAVMMTNGFLSRTAFISKATVKRQIVEIEKLNLVSAVRRQGMPTYYVVHLDKIDAYIESLEGFVKSWIEKSKNFDSKDKARSVKHDFDRNRKGIEKILKGLNTDKTMNYNNQAQSELTEPDQNELSTKIKMSQEPGSKRPVVEKDIDKDKQQQVKTNRNVIVPYSQPQIDNHIFGLKDKDGDYIIIEDIFKVYKNDYYDYVKNNKQKVIDYNYLVSDRIYDDDDDEAKRDKWEGIDKKLYAYNSIYVSIDSYKAESNRKAKKEYETTNKVADKNISNKNWMILENAYDALPNLDNQGRFYASKKIRLDFYSLSEHKQGLIVKIVKAGKEIETTTSAPSTLIKDAKNGKLQRVPKLTWKPICL